MYRLYWVSENKQGSVLMGEFSTREEASAAVPAADEELLSQALDEEDLAEPDGLMTKSAVRNGGWEIEKVTACDVR